MEMTVDRFELLEHAGDLGLQVWSSTREGIFVTAARGFFSILTDVKRIKPVLTQPISLQAGSDAELLVYWLNHLNFLFATAGLLLVNFTPLQIDDGKLTAIVSGESISPTRHEIYREIKAVTYHQLLFEKRSAGWFAQVILDL